MATRHYRLTDKITGKPVAVIEGRSKQECWSFMAQGLWNCEVATSKDVVSALKSGVPMFEAGKPAQTVAQPDPAPLPDYSEDQPKGHGTPEQA